MRDRLYHRGPFAVLLGHDVGIGFGAIDAETVLVGRVWGVAVGPVAIFWTQNVTRNAWKIRPRPKPDDFE